MNPISQCIEAPASMPDISKIEKSKSNKKFKYKDIWFFIATQNKDKYVQIYSVDLRVQVVSSVIGKNHALKILDKHIEELRKVINDSNLSR